MNHSYDINTLDDLIAALNGPRAAATKLAEPISPQAVCNWKAKGFVPPSRHLEVVLLLKRMGKSLNPALFDCSEDDWRLLGLTPAA